MHYFGEFRNAVPWLELGKRNFRLTKNLEDHLRKLYTDFNDTHCDPSKCLRMFKSLWTRAKSNKIIQLWAFESLTSPIYKLAVSGSVQPWLAKYFLLTVSILLKESESSIAEYLKRLFGLILIQSHYPTQNVYYEVLKHICEENMEYVSFNMDEFYDNPDLYILLEQITLDDSNGRTFLNGVNNKISPARIVSFLCTKIRVANKLLLSPLENGDIWVDININAQTLSIECDTAAFTGQTITDKFAARETLELPFHSFHHIEERGWITTGPLGREVIICFKTTLNCVYEMSWDALEDCTSIHIYMESGDQLSKFITMLKKLFGNNFWDIGYFPRRGITKMLSYAFDNVKGPAMVDKEFK